MTKPMTDERLKELQNLNVDEAPLASDAAGYWCKELVDECCHEIRRLREENDILKREDENFTLCRGMLGREKNDNAKLRKVVEVAMHSIDILVCDISATLREKLREMDKIRLRVLRELDKDEG